jgi:uncharacterized protein
MKLHEQSQARMNLVGRYGTGEIRINDRSFKAPLIVAPGFLQEAWITEIEKLDPAALAPLWPLEPRIVLLGSDQRPADRGKQLRTLLAARQVALEAMDLGAACRTYNVLAQEDRAVVALLFP